MRESKVCGFGRCPVVVCFAFVSGGDVKERNMKAYR
jgi:hypothetical protein